jgi:hypothetical protein
MKQDLNTTVSDVEGRQMREEIITRKETEQHEIIDHTLQVSLKCKVSSARRVILFQELTNNADRDD